MSKVHAYATAGRVASLHLHPLKPGEPLILKEAIEVKADQGIVGNARYFGRRHGNGQPSQRQVSLIEREQIAQHAAQLGWERIAPGAVRSNIETEGIELVPLIGRHIQIGRAILAITKPRDPCAKMDAIGLGLRALMLENRQGVLAVVVQSGAIRVGDAISVLARGC